LKNIFSIFDSSPREIRFHLTFASVCLALSVMAQWLQPIIFKLEYPPITLENTSVALQIIDSLQSVQSIKKKKNWSNGSPIEPIEKQYKVQINSIEINASDTADFERLPGIGTILAKRIVKYREKLGGYYQLQQLLEVYGVNKETFDNIKNMIYIKKPITLQKIRIDRSAFKALARHPYVGYENTRILFHEMRKNSDSIDLETYLRLPFADTTHLKKSIQYIDFQ
jgi:competence ComEA-like helix-hairpin-helix protein